MDAHEVYITGDVTFCEDVFPFAPQRKTLTENERQENNWRQQVVIDDETGLGDNSESNPVVVPDLSRAQQQERIIEDRESSSQLSLVQLRENRNYRIEGRRSSNKWA